MKQRKKEEENECGKKYSGHEKKKSCPVTLSRPVTSVTHDNLSRSQSLHFALHQSEAFLQPLFRLTPCYPGWVFSCLLPRPMLPCSDRDTILVLHHRVDNNIYSMVTLTNPRKSSYLVRSVLWRYDANNGSALTLHLVWLTYFSFSYRKTNTWSKAVNRPL